MSSLVLAALVVVVVCEGDAGVQLKACLASTCSRRLVWMRVSGEEKDEMI